MDESYYHRSRILRHTLSRLGAIAKGKGDSGQGHVYVDEWFTGAVERHHIHEDSRRVTQGAVLSILWWTDERPLEEIVARDEQSAYRRSDWRKDD
jgi:hypothetical protein